MSKGYERRQGDLENFEAEFAEVLQQAFLLKDPESAFVAEKNGRTRRRATEIDIKLFTLESKIARLREAMDLPPQVIPLGKKDRDGNHARPLVDVPWDPPPELGGSLYPVNPAELWDWIKDSGRDPGEVFAKVKCGGSKSRQSEASPFWRLATVECSSSRIPARLTLTLIPVPDGPDGVVAVKKFEQALERVVMWSATAVVTQSRERPRLLMVSYTRSTRELQLKAR